MSILNSIKNSFGITKESPLNDPETRLFIQLQANRDIALRQIIPTPMMNEFVTSIYTDQHLKSIVKDMYRNKLVNADSHSAFLQYTLRISLSIHGFGRRLILHHKVDPEVVAATMLRDTESTKQT